METQRINWLDLSEAQKAIVLEQARTYLQQQVAEAKLSKSVITVLLKYEGLKHCFYSLFPQSLWRKEIMCQNSESDAQFAEKCRQALEKSWGVDIPMPKSNGKKQIFKKSYWGL